MTIVDAHAHLPADVPEARELLAELDVRVLNICLGLDPEGSWRRQAFGGSEIFSRIAREHPDRFLWCTSFDLPTSTDLIKPAAYQERVRQQLDADFDAGAVACKIWKNIGMEVRDSRGRFLMVDDPVFCPILELVEQRERTLILHIGEPKACWLPLDPASPHYGYYANNPEWHMYGRPDFPAHEALMAARDRVADRHPRLRMIGAHLASLEHSLDELAERLERFPNFAVDTAERLLDLALQPRERVRGFFERYADRILFGSDLGTEAAFSAQDSAELEQTLGRLRSSYDSEREYYKRSGTVRVRGRNVIGLALSEPVQKQFFTANAERWLGLS